MPAARRADSRPAIGIPKGSVPVIYVFSQSDDPSSCSLLPDDEGGARLATEHLLGLGRRRIAHVTGPEHFEAVRLRRQGYRAALRKAHTVEPKGFFIAGKWSEEWGRDAVAKLFDGRSQPPDGIFCGNDQIARGVCEALHERKLSVPMDVSVVGFDNWDVMTEASRPKLTSIDMNLTELGREAGRVMVQMIAGMEFKGTRRLPCTLAVRDSCGANAPANKG